MSFNSVTSKDIVIINTMINRIGTEETLRLIAKALNAKAATARHNGHAATSFALTSASEAVLNTSLQVGGLLKLPE